MNVCTDERLNKIAPEKLQLLQELSMNSEHMSSAVLLPHMLNKLNEAHEKGIDFTEDETELLEEILLERMTPEQQSRFQILKKLSKMMQK